MRDSVPHYRPDVDGLRAIAVLAVLIFHAFPSILPGGFTGVDIFFVISGFLITGILRRELESGTFSLLHFYRRRVNRLFPALALVLFATLLLGYFVFLPGEFRQLGRHAFGSAAFFSNYYFRLEPGYFDASAETKPLQHLWSLSVEEQFYLAWPLLLVFSWRWRALLWPNLCLLLTTSFLANLFYSDSHPSFAFYMPQTRAWEFLAGAALALHPPSSSLLRNSRLPHACACSGALLVAASLYNDASRWNYPSYWALLPVAGSALLILAGPQAWLNQQLLSHPLPVFLGRISYPLYLWHWPLLVYFRLLNDTDFHLPTNTLSYCYCACLLLATLLAWLTYRLWETPLRHELWFRPSRNLAFLLAAVFLLAAFSRAVQTRKLSPRHAHSRFGALEAALVDFHEPAFNYKAQTLKIVEIPSASAESILFFGDSHLQHYWSAIEAYVKAHPTAPRAEFISHGGCIPLPHVTRVQPGHRCEENYELWRARARSPRVRTLVLSAYWAGYLLGPFSPYGPIPQPAGFRLGDRSPLTAEDWDTAWQGLATDLRALHHSGKRIVILADSPNSRTFHPLRLVSRFTGQIATEHHFSRTSFEDYLQPVTLRLTQLAARSGAELILPLDAFCDGDRCPAFDPSGKPLYRDGNHLRPFAVLRYAAFVEGLMVPPPGQALTP